MAGFFLAGSALAPSGWLLAASPRLEGAELLLGWWSAVCAEVVAASELLSLAHAIRPFGYALFEAAAQPGA